MKQIFSYGILTFILNAGTVTARCQQYSNDYSTREKIFVYKIHQLDEFFGRFNNDSSCLIREYYREKKIPFKVKRFELVRSLFNFETGSWKESEIDSFVNNAMLVRMPSEKNYYGENWFAEINAIFSYNGTPSEIPIVLSLNVDNQRRSKWSLLGIRQDIIAPEETLLENQESPGLQPFLSPSAGGTDFIELTDIFEDKSHLQSYFDDKTEMNGQTISFINGIKKDRLKFLRIRKIKYFFFQVSNFIFTVEYYDRKTLNSGWLISRLTYSSPLEKKEFIRKLLGKQN